MHMNSCAVVSRYIQTYKSAFAEKPSIAKIIAEHLSKGRCRTSKGISRACQTYEFITWCISHLIQLTVSGSVGQTMIKIA